MAESTKESLEPSTLASNANGFSGVVERLDSVNRQGFVQETPNVSGTLFHADNTVLSSKCEEQAEKSSSKRMDVDPSAMPHSPENYKATRSSEGTLSSKPTDWQAYLPSHHPNLSANSTHSQDSISEKVESVSTKQLDGSSKALPTLRQNLCCEHPTEEAHDSSEDSVEVDGLDEIMQESEFDMQDESSDSSETSESSEEEESPSSESEADETPLTELFPQDVYCLCRQPHGNRFMICCDSCDEWYHGDCVNIKESEASVMGTYLCPNCKSGAQRKRKDIFASHRETQKRQKRDVPTIDKGSMSSLSSDETEGRKRAVGDSAELRQKLKQQQLENQRRRIEEKRREQEKQTTIRKTVIKMLAMAISSKWANTSSERQTIEATAESIENALFQKFGSAGKDYKDHYRSIYFNLKDSRNAVFFKRVMSNEITPQQLASMSATEMASQEVVEKRREVEEKLKYRNVVRTGEEPEVILKKKVEEQQYKKHSQPIPATQSASISESPKLDHSNNLDSLLASIEKRSSKNAYSAKSMIDDENKQAESAKQQSLQESHSKIPSFSEFDSIEQGNKFSSVWKKEVKESLQDKFLSDQVGVSAPSLELDVAVPSRTASESTTTSESTSGAESRDLFSTEPCWTGAITKPVGRVHFTAYELSGPSVASLLPSEFEYIGRMKLDQLYKYLSQLDYSKSCKRSLLYMLWPTEEGNDVRYNAFYNYFYRSGRGAVLKPPSIEVKEIFLFPINMAKGRPRFVSDSEYEFLKTLQAPQLLMTSVITHIKSHLPEIEPPSKQPPLQNNPVPLVHEDNNNTQHVTSYSSGEPRAYPESGLYPDYLGSEYENFSHPPLYDSQRMPTSQPPPPFSSHLPAPGIADVPASHYGGHSTTIYPSQQLSGNQPYRASLEYPPPPSYSQHHPRPFYADLPYGAVPPPLYRHGPAQSPYAPAHQQFRSEIQHPRGSHRGGRSGRRGKRKSRRSAHSRR